MIKAVSFDFYNTLVRFWPPLEEIQQAACHELGLSVQEDDMVSRISIPTFPSVSRPRRGRWISSAMTSMSPSAMDGAIGPGCARID